MERLVKEPDGSVVLYIGAKNWPTPIPIVKKGNAWFLDTHAGRKEILYRRIGRNEISTIKVCQELVAAEREYYATQHNEYAKQIFSDKGQHNGLYWQAADGEPQSPIGPLVAWWRLGTVKMLESHITSGKPLRLETDRQAADRDCTISRTVRRTRG